ncbi:hypothetical protein [Mesorhizobium temperatum]|uniref:hypothetical protein n=1 Tax=Mesorhizobium temperatum TaxID=241416 RepID=UPI0011814790|nr:hypothetical protein [Mesorhizobium temperatum]
MNYHDLEKAREAARKIPGGSGGAQAARNTGPVIRIASAKRREKLVMAGLLTETADIEKPELSVPSLQLVRSQCIRPIRDCRAKGHSHREIEAIGRRHADHELIS